MVSCGLVGGKRVEGALSQISSLWVRCCVSGGITLSTPAESSLSGQGENGGVQGEHLHQIRNQSYQLAGRRRPSVLRIDNGFDSRVFLLFGVAPAN